jgi:O-antigen ligase
MTCVSRGAVNLFSGAEKELLFDHLGKPRVTVGVFVIPVAAVMAFARYRQKANVLFLFAAIALFAELLLIHQTRGFIAASLASMLVIYALSFKLTPVRIALYLILTGTVLATSLFVSPPDISSLSVVERSESDFSKQAGRFGNSVQARLNAYSHYWEQIQQNPITGRGIYNFNWKGNTEKRLQEVKGIHLSDIGITSFVVQAGLIGIVWLVFGLCKIWRDMWLFRNHLVVSCYFVIGTFTMPTLDMFFRRDSLFLFATFLGLWSSVILAIQSGKSTEEI